MSHRIAAALLLSLIALTAAACRSATPATYSPEVRDRTGTFIVYGDTRPWLPAEVWRETGARERRLVLDRIVAEDPDFVVNSGDVVAVGSSRRHWARFDREMEALRAKEIPYLPALGNHDYWIDAEPALENWFARFPDLEGRKWYERTYRGVRLLVLDNNRRHLLEYEKAAQERWFRARLIEAEEDDDVHCVIVVAHESPYSNAVFSEDCGWFCDAIVEPAKRSPKVRAFFTGHVHSYERFRQDGVEFVVSGGGGAPPMDVRARGRRWPDLHDGPRRYHFCRLTVHADRIDVEVVMLAADETWFVADVFTIECPRRPR